MPIEQGSLGGVSSIPLQAKSVIDYGVLPERAAPALNGIDAMHCSLRAAQSRKHVPRIRRRSDHGGRGSKKGRWVLLA